MVLAPNGVCPQGSMVDHCQVCLGREPWQQSLREAARARVPGDGWHLIYVSSWSVDRPTWPAVCGAKDQPEAAGRTNKKSASVHTSSSHPTTAWHKACCTSVRSYLGRILLYFPHCTGVWGWVGAEAK